MAASRFENIEGSEVLWRDRKRILGMPISFTRYEVDAERFTLHKGLFTTVTDELLLYRILDLKMTRTLGQKLFGVGTITLYSADQTSHTMEVQSIKHPDKVRRFLSRLVEQTRNSKGVTGREIIGMAGSGASHGDCASDGPCVPPSPGDFADVDGDGIPD